MMLEPGPLLDEFIEHCRPLVDDEPEKKALDIIERELEVMGSVTIQRFFEDTPDLWWYEMAYGHIVQPGSCTAVGACLKAVSEVVMDNLFDTLWWRQVYP